MTKVAFVCNSDDNIAYVYAQGREQQIRETYDCVGPIINQENASSHAEALRDVEIIFSTWGFWEFDEETFALFPKLKAVFYGAGSVKRFAVPFLERGIVVMSSWAANAIPVAEYTLAQILLSSKQYWQQLPLASSRQQFREERLDKRTIHGIYEQRVALIGAGMIGRTVIKLLKPFHIHVCVVDPYLSEEDAKELGVERIELADAFATCQVVSNHLPNIPSTVGMLTREHFSSMLPYATFINTGRGAQIVEDDLQAVLNERSDIVALLDVTSPEPPIDDSPFYSMENVYLTPHIAGSIGNEVVRMADYVIEEARRFLNGETLTYAVDLEMLERMA